MICEVQEACVAGSSISIRIHMENHGILPIGKILLKMSSDNRMFNLQETRNLLLEPGERKTAEFQIPYHSDDCGKVRLYLYMARCYDVCGLTWRTIRYEEDFTLTVYPKLLDIQTSPKMIPSSKSMGEQYDLHRHGNDVNEVFDMRDYQEGDSLRSIHWKLSGKLDRLIVREFGHPSNYETMLLMDTGYKEQGEAYRFMIDQIMELTVSLSRGLMQSSFGHHVGYVHDSTMFESTVHDRGTWLEMMTSMMSLQLCNQGEHVVESFLKSGLQQYCTKVVLITGSFDEGRFGQMAESVDLQVIQLKLEDGDFVESAHTYDLMHLSVNSLQEKVHMIEI